MFKWLKRLFQHHPTNAQWALSQVLDHDQSVTPSAETAIQYAESYLTYLNKHK